MAVKRLLVRHDRPLHRGMAWPMMGRNWPATVGYGGP